VRRTRIDNKSIVVILIISARPSQAAAAGKGRPLRSQSECLPFERTSVAAALPRPRPPDIAQAEG